MARVRKKPEGSFIERAKNEDTMLTKKAYEIGRIRGRKETIEKACDAYCKQCNTYPLCQQRGIFDCIGRKNLEKAMEE